MIESQILNSIPGLVHGFSDSKVGDDLKKVASFFKREESRIYLLNQIHSEKIISVLTPEYIHLPHDADGFVSNQNSILFGIRTADCVPVLMAIEDGKFCSALHAGWKGVVYGILPRAIEIIQKMNPHSDLKIALGPSLCFSCFEIGPEVKEIFLKKYSSETVLKKGEKDRWHIDLRETLVNIIAQMNVKRGKIDNMNLCTKCSPDRFFSYRRGDHQKRQISVIGIV